MGRRLWLMLPALLMSLELSKSMPLLKKRPSALLSLKLLNLNNAWLKLMRLLPRVDVLPWLNLSLASGSWKLSLAAAKAKLVRPSRDSKRLSAVSRSFSFQQDEDHKNQDRMSELAGKLQQRIKTYKK